tara:strand:+ start:2235 stop:2600 length:366 start_codon:yes stop_codon:yes gene_type:complete
MISEVREIYKCEHCRKVYQRKHACISHEPKCRKNPVNIPKCNNCNFLQSVDMRYEPTYQSYMNNDDLSKGRCFKCTSKEIYMFHPSTKHGEYGIPDYVEIDGNEIVQEEMPKECDKFNDGW